jgi:hypothetical protein
MYPITSRSFAPGFPSAASTPLGMTVGNPTVAAVAAVAAVRDKNSLRVTLFAELINLSSKRGITEGRLPGKLPLLDRQNILL